MCFLYVHFTELCETVASIHRLNSIFKSRSFIFFASYLRMNSVANWPLSPWLLVHTSRNCHAFSLCFLLFFSVTVFFQVKKRLTILPLPIPASLFMVQLFYFESLHHTCFFTLSSLLFFSTPSSSFVSLSQPPRQATSDNWNIVTFADKNISSFSLLCSNEEWQE